MNKKEKLIKEIKESHKVIDNYIKLFRCKLYRMMKEMSIKDLEQIEEDTDVELYYSKEDYKQIIEIEENKK